MDEKDQEIISLENAILSLKRWAIDSEKNGKKLMAQHCLNRIVALEIKLIGIKSFKKNKKKI